MKHNLLKIKSISFILTLFFIAIASNSYALDIGGTVPIEVETIAELKTHSGNLTSNKTAIVLGYYAKGDGGGGPKRIWVEGASPGTYIDNGGATIIPNGGDGSEAWVWDYSGNFDVKWFGAIANDLGSAATNRPLLQAAIDWAGEVKGNPYLDDTFYVSGRSDSEFEPAIKYCLKIDEDNTSLLGIGGKGKLIFDNESLTDEVMVLLVGNDSTSGSGSDENNFTYTENNDITGLTISTTDIIDKFTSITNFTFVRAVLYRFAKNSEFAHNRLEGLFKEGVQVKSFSIGINIHNNYAKYCLGAGAFNLNGAGAENCTIRDNIAEFCFQAVEDGGLNNTIENNTSRYNLYGYRISGTSTLRSGAKFRNNKALFTSNQPFLIRPDQYSNLLLEGNTSKVSAFGAYRAYPGDAAPWGKVYNTLTIKNNYYEDANLSGFANESGYGFALYGDKISAKDNDGGEPTGNYFKFAINLGTDIDKIFPLDNITTSSGGTGTIVLISLANGVSGSQVATLITKDTLGLFKSGDTFSIAGKGTISGTLTEDADNTKIPPVGMQFIEDSGDTVDELNISGNFFLDATTPIKKGAIVFENGTIITDILDVPGKISNKINGTINFEQALEFTNEGDTSKISPTLNNRYTVVSTIELPITTATVGRGGAAFVFGQDGIQRFVDLVLFGANGVAPEATVIANHDVNGTPATRSYAVDSSQRLTLTMTSGSYEIRTFGILGRSW